MRIFKPKNSYSNSPSGRKFPKLNFKINWKKWGKIFLIVFGAGILLLAGAFAWFSKDLPSPGKLTERVVAQSTKIYDRTGTHLLYDIHGEEKRTQIPYYEMPENIRFATIALEDSDFYSHKGFDMKGLFKAVCHEASSRIGLGNLGGLCPPRGGSTISQQFIKNSILTSEKKYSRKIKELILAVRIEQKYTKDQILEMYLNEIPYGSNAYGIEAAAQTFFGRHARELTLDEAALLAALPNAPTYYSPHGSHPEALIARKDLVLRRMRDLGYITEEQMNESKDIDTLAKISPHRENINAPHFVMYVREYLEEKYGQQEMEQGGFKVFTTLDWDKQQIAERVVREGAEKNVVKWGAENAALVAMDPKTGQILAMVGSKDYFDKTIDGQVNVTVRDRQPGSSFKPYVYLTAFSKGYTPETNIWDVDTNFSTDDGKIYNPKNYDGKNIGLLELKDALGRSLNVPAVKTLYLAGVQNSIDMAKKMGITTLNEKDRYGLSLVLGGGEVKLLDHVNAFSTLATGGTYRPKQALLKVEDGDGNILEEYKNGEGEKVVDEKYVAMLDYILSTNAFRAPVFGENNPLRFDNRQVVAKTGTTNEWRDGWTLGYTPSLAAGVWAGNNDNTPMKEGADGSYVASPIWRAFMEEALKNYAIEKFPEYKKEENLKDALAGKLDMDRKLEVCKIPGTKDEYCLANDNCPNSERDEKKFADAHSILYYLQKDDPRGNAPENPEKDPQFKNWEKAVRDWLKDQKDFTSDPAPTEKCKASDFEKYEPKVSIKSPGNGDTITSAFFTIKVSTDAPFKVDKLTLSIDGNEVKSTGDDSLNYDYSVPEGKKTSTLEIKANVKDKNDNSDSETIKIHTNIPQN